ncbi:glycosyltransferase [Peteryoungia desertarenae]|uniref:Glycosyltransferase n=1 Tax=Peteryoungia desertarenae TaxID=1813451 RepID=A0ABX6QNT7_9HYPH|nr:glycosyltransferase [Peteryoungia desertarenae]QLF69820.1 glycosyltransferase [Peteryoungia desertarenae]
MQILLVSSAPIPAIRYGGAERIILWLGRALTEMGHQASLMAPDGSSWAYGKLYPFDSGRPLEAQIPPGIDVVHSHTGLDPDYDGKACVTIHGNSKEVHRFHANSIFLSAHHAQAHGGKVFVYNGVDPRAYPEPDLLAHGGSLTFLAKAAWKVKNVTGAIRVARKAGLPIDILGGHRLNLKMGFRLTLDPNARFKGMVDDIEKARYLRPSSGLLFPVRWHEPFGVAVIEAMYFGLPIFATPYGSLPELVPEFAGRLSAEGDELAAAIRRIEDYDRRAIHAHFQAHFTAEQMAKRYLELYQRIEAGESLHPDAFMGKVARDAGLLPWQD